MTQEKTGAMKVGPIVGLVETFQARALAEPDRLFAKMPDGSPLTFGALSRRADAAIAFLWDTGVRPGDRVVVMMRNSPQALAIIYGLMRAGMVWVPTNPTLVGDALAHAIHLVEARIVICDPDVVDNIEACGATAELGNLSLVGLPDMPPETAPKPWAGQPPSKNDLAALMFTSGTTGPSKATMVTYMMLELAVRAVIDFAGIVPGDNLYQWEPFYHIGGAQVILTPILTDVVLTIRERFSASRFWSDVAASGCTHIHHLGGIIQILLKLPPTPEDRAHGVRIAWGGGCATDVWRPFEARFGVELRECYGMTEACSITTQNSEGVLGCVGRPLPWFSVELKDEGGQIVGPGEGSGEIVVTTSLPGAIFPGYYRNPEATAKALRDDGFHTGDLGSWNEDGLLRFHGRMGDSVRVRGELVSAHEVESVANQHPDVEESAITGVPAEIGENDIQLFLRLRTDATEDPEGVYRWLAERLAPHQRPAYIAFIDAFPKTPSQRIQKHRLPKSPADRWVRRAAVGRETA